MWGLSAAMFAGPFADPAIAAASDSPGIAIEVGPDAVAAFSDAWVRDARIAELLDQRRLADVATEARLVRAAIERVAVDVRTDDRSAARRIDSAAAETLRLADRLASVAESGNLARATTVYRNLHRYLEFVRGRWLSDRSTTGPWPSSSGGSTLMDGRMLLGGVRLSIPRRPWYARRTTVPFSHHGRSRGVAHAEFCA